MKKSTQILNLEQAAEVTRQYLSTAAASPTAESLRGRCSRGSGPPRVADPHSPSNAPIRFLRSKVIAWCEAQLPERVRLGMDVLQRAEEWEARLSDRGETYAIDGQSLVRLLLKRGRAAGAPGRVTRDRIEIRRPS